MELRVICSLVGLCLVAVSAVPLFARTPNGEPPTCCVGPSDCGTGQTCCDAESLGLDPCNAAAPGWCCDVPLAGADRPTAVK
jgi:hypothetical protein